jgi:hypothetical protein
MAISPRGLHHSKASLQAPTALREHLVVVTQQEVLPPAIRRQDPHRSIRTLPIRLQPLPAHSRLLQPAPQEAPARTIIQDSLRARHHQCISHHQLDLTPRRERTRHLGTVLTKRLLHSQEHQAFRLVTQIVRVAQPTLRTDQHQALEDIKQAAVLLQARAVGHQTTRHPPYLSPLLTGTTSPTASTAMAHNQLSTSSRTVWIRWLLRTMV